MVTERGSCKKPSCQSSTIVCPTWSYKHKKNNLKASATCLTRGRTRRGSEYGVSEQRGLFLSFLVCLSFLCCFRFYVHACVHRHGIDNAHCMAPASYPVLKRQVRLSLLSVRLFARLFAPSLRLQHAICSSWSFNTKKSPSSLVSLYLSLVLYRQAAYPVGHLCGMHD